MYTRRKELESNEASADQESVERSDEVDSDETDASRSNFNVSENTSSFASLGKVQGLSSKKSESESSSSDVDAARMEGFRFVDMAILGSIFELLLCPICKKNHVELEEDRERKMGFSSLLFVKCTGKKCGFIKRFYSSSRVGTSQAFEVNRRAVLASRNIGVGHQGLVKFAGTMNMPPPMNENAYRDILEAVKKAAQTVCQQSMTAAVDDAKRFYEPEEDGVFEIGISGDGTWRRRGYSSLYGIVTAISTVTGKVVDIEIMSKDCKECTVWRNKEGTQEFEDWWEGHQHLCQANHLGSSGSMDASGLLAIFERSVESYAVCYTEFLGDGDSKAHKLIVDEAVYGEREVTKLECVGHVQKRLGSRLRSLKKRMGPARLEDGKPIGGIGRLTNNKIDQLQVYYGKAIRNNTHDIQSMENAVMAIWHHTRSSDENPDHDLCPPGENSWCGFQRDLAKGTTDYRHTHSLPSAVANAVHSTFEALSDQTLLQRCLHGGTQNRNEAINALIWQRATKETHSGLPTVELAAYLAVSHFNDGSDSVKLVLKELGITPGLHCSEACKKLDYNRLRHARRKSSDQSKERRKQIRNWKKGYSDHLEAIEGPQYEAGAF